MAASPEKRLKRSAPVDEEGKQPEIKLWSYFRSSCSWRVRIALAHKGLKYDYQPIHLIKDGGEQLKEEYVKINSVKSVPAIQVGGDEAFGQSLAILEYLDERFPESPLLPKDFEARARARQIAQIIACDTQPIQNLRVLTHVKAKLGDDEKAAWAKKWIEFGLQAAEVEVSRFGGKFCVGEEFTQADLCLVPQLYNARRFGVNLDAFPKLLSVEKECQTLPAFQAAHPSKQPDCPPDTPHPS